MAQSELREIKGALAAALGKAALGENAQVLAPVWAEAVGAQLAQHSRPRRLDGGVLIAEVEASLLPELMGVRELLRERINARLGRATVSRIELVGR